MIQKKRINMSKWHFHPSHHKPAGIGCVALIGLSFLFIVCWPFGIAGFIIFCLYHAIIKDIAIDWDNVVGLIILIVVLAIAIISPILAFVSLLPKYQDLLVHMSFPWAVTLIDIVVIAYFLYRSLKAK